MAERRKHTDEWSELIIQRARTAARAVLTSRELPLSGLAAPSVDLQAWERLSAVRSTRTALGALREALTAVDNAAASCERALETQGAVGQMQWTINRSFASLDERLSELTEPGQRAAEIRRTVSAALGSSRFQQFAERLEAVADRRRSGSEWTQAAHTCATAARDALRRMQRGIAEDAPPTADQEADWAEFRDASAAVLQEALATAQVLAQHADDAWARAANDLDEALAILTHLRSHS